MSGRGWQRWVPFVLGVLLAVLASGCSGASWHETRGTLPTSPSGRVVVRVYGEVVDEDGIDPIGVFAAAIRDELSEAGVDALVTVSPQHTPPAPRYDVHVVAWDPGSRFVRWFIGFGAGRGTMELTVSHLRVDEREGFEGSLEGYVVGGWFGGDSADAADIAGRAVARAILSGHPD